MNTFATPSSAPSALSDREFEFQPKDFAKVRSLIYARAGINLHEGKQAMVYKIGRAHV